MTKQEVYQYLTAHGIDYQVTEHKAVYHMTETDMAALPYPQLIAKTLFLQDDKGNGYLLSVKGEKRVNLRAFKKEHGLKGLSFVSEEELMSVLGLRPGAVTPLGILNDDTCSVRFYLDAAFTGGLIGIHPNENTATVWMQVSDLMRVIQEHGNPVFVAQI